MSDRNTSGFTWGTEVADERIFDFRVRRGRRGPRFPTPDYCDVLFLHKDDNDTAPLVLLPWRTWEALLARARVHL
jgi:hypothetical protein